MKEALGVVVLLLHVLRNIARVISFESLAELIQSLASAIAQDMPA